MEPILPDPPEWFEDEEEFRTVFPDLHKEALSFIAEQKAEYFFCESSVFVSDEGKKYVAIVWETPDDESLTLLTEWEDNIKVNFSLVKETE